MTTLTQTDILQRLGSHQPIGRADAHRGIAVRWIATAALVTLLPLGWVMVSRRNPFFNDHPWAIAISLALLGFLGMFIAWRASRRAATERQWGLSALTSAECMELHELSSSVPAIQPIVDHWLSVWIDTGQSPRGRDLALVREMVAAWEHAPSGVLKSTGSSEPTISTV